MKKNLLLSAALLLTGGVLLAQEDQLIVNSDNILNSEQINIDGSLQMEEKTSSEILEEARKKNEMQNVKRIAKQIEKIKLPERQVKKITDKEAQKLTDRINGLFGEEEAEEKKDAVSNQMAAPVMQAAPVTPIIIEREVPVVAPPKKVENNIKMTPYFGMINILGDYIDFESKLSAGLTLESAVGKRFSVGAGFNYSTLDIKDISPAYQYIYPNGRELTYQHYRFDVQSKLFLTVESRVRPFLGLGLSYNRANLQFEDEGVYADASPYGGEEFNSNYIAASGFLGTEIAFNDNVGLNLEVRYTKGLSNNFNVESLSQTTDQAVLDRLGKDIQKADFYSVNAGLQVAF